MPDKSSISADKKLVLFIYRAQDARCHPRTLYDRLHGHTEIRSMRDEFGRVFHKKYEYPGIPHQRITQQVFVATRKNARAVEELFERFGVSYIRCSLPIFVRWGLSRPLGEKSA